jgi:excisionase family DNA binding protein
MERNSHRLVPIDEAAAYLGRNERFMRRVVAQRVIPFYRVGHRILFDIADLDAYLAACRVEPSRNWPPTVGGR